jgi:hypothetical protein
MNTWFWEGKIEEKKDYELAKMIPPLFCFHEIISFLSHKIESIFLGYISYVYEFRAVLSLCI